MNRKSILVIISTLMLLTLFLLTVSIDSSVDDMAGKFPSVISSLRSGIINKCSTVDGEWDCSFGGKEFDYGFSLDVVNDGGYILVGGTMSYGDPLDEDVWLIKTDADGNKVWDKVFNSGGSVDCGYSVQQTSDGGYVIVGSASNGLWLIKTDVDGEIEWEKIFGRGSDLGYYIQQTSDGGYVIVGCKSSSGYSNDDVWLIKTDKYGNMLWNRTFGGDSMDVGFSIDITNDGKYIVAGITNSYGMGSSDIWLIKVDMDGNMLWNRTFGGKDMDWVYSISGTSDGGFIVVGSTHSFGYGSEDIWAIKCDSYGNMIWNKTFGGGSFDWATFVEETSDGGFIIMGNTASYSHGGSDFWLIKTDRYGNKEWSRILGDKGYERGYSVKETMDGGYIMVGYKDSSTASKTDIWLVKVMPDDLPPSKPVVSGSTTGRINKPYKINFSAVDPEGDDIYYFVVVWYYGVSGWLGPYKSGETASFTFPPTKEGSFNITVKAMDDRGCDGPVSDPICVTFPKPHWLNLLPPFIQRILSINFFHYT